MLKLTALLLILSLADANTKWWCDTYIDKDLWSTIPVCANGGDDSVPAWCGNIAESIKGCVQICKIDSTPACDFTGNGYDWCNYIDKDNWPFIPQCGGGGGGVNPCEDDYDNKFKYGNDIYSCKQLNRLKKKYRKRICTKEESARKLCAVICKNKV